MNVFRILINYRKCVRVYSTLFFSSFKPVKKSFVRCRMVIVLFDLMVFALTQVVVCVWCCSQCFVSFAGDVDHSAMWLFCLLSLLLVCVHWSLFNELCMFKMRRVLPIFIYKRRQQQIFAMLSSFNRHQ